MIYPRSERILRQTNIAIFLLKEISQNFCKHNLRNGCSLKYELCRHSSAVARLLGSYMKRKLSKRNPAAESQGKRCFKLLYGCCLRVKFCSAGKELNSGQIASDGVPKIMKSIVG